MALELKGALAKLLKKTELEIVGIEDESTADSQIIAVTVREPVTAVGSTLWEGHEVKATDTKIFITKNDYNDLEDFQNAIVERDGKYFYSGTMKFDAARPKLDTKGNVQQKSRIWMTNMVFSKRKGDGFKKTQLDREKLVKDFFAKAGVTATPVADVKPDASKVAESVKDGKPVVAGARIGG